MRRSKAHHILVAATIIAGWVTIGSAQILTHVGAYFDDDVQGALTINGLNFVYATAVSPDGKHVYACGGNGGLIESDNALVVFSRDPGSGELTFVEVEFDDDDTNDTGTADGLFSCRDLVVSPDGKHVYTAGFSENEIGIFSRNAATGEVTFSTVVADGVGGVDGLAGVEALAMTSDGAALFAAGSIDDAVVAFTRNASTGGLTLADAEFDGAGVGNALDRPVDIAVSPGNEHVYTASGGNENFTGSDAVAAFSWNGGGLAHIESYAEGATQGPNVIDGLHWASGVTVSPDGKHLYATGGLDPAGDKDWIAIFERDSGTGKLTWKEAIDDFNFCDFDILFGFETYGVVAPDDRFYATSSRTALAAFKRDAVSGGLTFLNGRCLFDELSLGINLPKKLAIDPLAKRHVYVPGTADDAVSAFRVCNPTLDGENRVLPDQVVTTVTTEVACESLTAAEYKILAGGDAMLIAPIVILQDGFEVNGGVLTVVDP